MKDYIDSNVRSCDKSRVPCIIRENKIDLLPKEAQMNDTTLKEFSSDNEFYSSFRVSVKDGINRKESMECLLKEIIRRKEKYEPTRLRKEEEKKEKEAERRREKERYKDKEPYKITIKSYYELTMKNTKTVLSRIQLTLK